MEWQYFAGLILVALLLVYLVYVIFKPEKF
ncbi:MAG: K(+)-transporting ATPase subunit F [Bacteroidetes bacterium]|nr:K(+)-transporting ATPase subunit F [Bacteroidota bacterium]